jgi:hypothetical protein
MSEALCSLFSPHLAHSPNQTHDQGNSTNCASGESNLSWYVSSNINGNYPVSVLRVPCTYYPNRIRAPRSIRGRVMIEEKLLHLFIRCWTIFRWPKSNHLLAPSHRQRSLKCNHSHSKSVRTEVSSTSGTRPIAHCARCAHHAVPRSIRGRAINVKTDSNSVRTEVNSTSGRYSPLARWRIARALCTPSPQRSPAFDSRSGNRRSSWFFFFNIRGPVS